MEVVSLMECSLFQDAVKNGEGWLSSTDLSCKNAMAKHISTDLVGFLQSEQCAAHFFPCSFIGEKKKYK